MELKTPREIQQALAMPFAPEDLEWRLQTTFEDNMRGVAVPYVTNRAIQNRLDDVVGPENWYNDYKPWHGNGKKEAQICGISIYFEGRGFITKWDGAEDSDIEPVKGGLSDSMKRAAVQWGIGRVLYSMDTVYVDIEKKGRSFIIKASERSRLDNAYLNMLKSLNLAPAPAGGVQSLLTPKTGPEAPTKQPQQTQNTARPASAPVQMQQSAPQPQSRPQPVPATATASQPVPAPVPSQPTPAPAYEYMVCAAKKQNGMNGVNTLVSLQSADGKQFSAFVRGDHPYLTPGALLSQVKLSMKTQDSVVFYVMDEYQFVQTVQQAA